MKAPNKKKLKRIMKAPNKENHEGSKQKEVKENHEKTNDLEISIPRDRLEPQAWPRLNVTNISSKRKNIFQANFDLKQ